MRESVITRGHNARRRLKSVKVHLARAKSNGANIFIGMCTAHVRYAYIPTYARLPCAGCIRTFAIRGVFALFERNVVCTLLVSRRVEYSLLPSRRTGIYVLDDATNCAPRCSRDCISIWHTVVKKWRLKRAPASHIFVFSVLFL